MMLFWCFISCASETFQILSPVIFSNPYMQITESFIHVLFSYSIIGRLPACYVTCSSWLSTVVHLCVFFQYTCIYCFSGLQVNQDSCQGLKFGDLSPKELDTFFEDTAIWSSLYMWPHKVVVQDTSFILYPVVIGTLNFVTLISPTSLSRIDDTSSSPISTYGAFPFGTGYVNSVYVRTHSVHVRVHKMYIPLVHSVHSFRKWHA